MPYFSFVIMHMEELWRQAQPLSRIQNFEMLIKSSRLKKSNKMKHCAEIYLLLNYSTYFGFSSRPSSGVHKTVVAASGTASFLKRDQIRTDWGPSLTVIMHSPYLVTFEEAFSPDSMICTRGCNYSFMYS